MKRLRNYFVGDSLAAEPDPLRQASINLMCNILLLCQFSLVVLTITYIINNNPVQVLKGLLILALFTGCLFYIKRFRKIEPIGHLMLLISWGNIQIDVFVLFQEISMFPA